ncbi:fee2d7a7-8022-4e44-93e2-6a94592a6143 [Sclerotinia trifoliorum]|uniref:Fee2d7a7-8022-4e44-93e2-6a94592a6143 n=1 Tax=Sclerotinia trifoliorum TaxID=28548 RepID=A0A8H2VLL3_9HELO|nr:fee2d7a7-8022-4e44-93e2-6a94592a6143 [Sclerotinia trifoliorum]
MRSPRRRRKKKRKKKMRRRWLIQKISLRRNARNQQLVLLLSTTMMSVLSELQVVRNKSLVRTVLKSSSISHTALPPVLLPSSGTSSSKLLELTISRNYALNWTRTF